MTDAMDTVPIDFELIPDVVEYFFSDHELNSNRRQSGRSKRNIELGLYEMIGQLTMLGGY